MERRVAFLTASDGQIFTVSLERPRRKSSNDDRVYALQTRGKFIGSLRIDTREDDEGVFLYVISRAFDEAYRQVRVDSLPLLAALVREAVRFDTSTAAPPPPTTVMLDLLARKRVTEREHEDDLEAYGDAMRSIGYELTYSFIMPNDTDVLQFVRSSSTQRAKMVTRLRESTARRQKYL